MENRPTAVGSATFVYDGDGNRVKKTENSETTIYVNKYYEKNTSTGTVTTYYYHGGRLVALRNGSNLRYVHQDHLGGTNVVTNSSGTQLGYTRYFPFGSTRDSSGSLETDKEFTGQRLDGTGLYYYNARYYDPTLGRFISPDTLVQSPANPQSRNRYSYCLNNPLKYSDPSGLITVIVAGDGSTSEGATGYKNWSHFVDYLECLGEEVFVIMYDEESMETGTRTDALIHELNKNELEDINLVGFSEGGNVVLDFLARMVEGDTSIAEGVKSQINNVFVLNGAVDGISNNKVGGQRYKSGDRYANLPALLAERGYNIGVLDIVNQDNVTGHSGIPGIEPYAYHKGSWVMGHLSTQMMVIHHEVKHNSDVMNRVGQALQSDLTTFLTM